VINTAPLPTERYLSLVVDDIGWTLEATHIKLQSLMPTNQSTIEKGSTLNFLATVGDNL
jgi:hypothetical protein